MTRELAAKARRARILSVALGAVWVGGCSFAMTEGTSVPTSGYGCLDDSKACVDQRQAALKHLLADRDRGWVRQPATAEDYASGVRMYAFKSRRKELPCDDLKRGHTEADAASTTLKSASGRLSPAQISRGMMFAAEVSREISAEMRRRCRA